MSELALEVPARPRFGAAMAIGTLLLFLAAQVSIGMVIAAGVVVANIAQHGVNDTAAISAELNDLGPLMVLASAAVSAAVTLFVTRAWAWHLVTDRGAGGIGMIVPSARQILLAILAGVALGAIYVVVAEVLLPPRNGTPLGPLMKIAASGMFGRLSFAFVALLVAPPVEELLFRGLLLKGFAESWGIARASVIVSIVFVLLHVPETMHYWPSLLAVTSLAVAVLAARLMTGSVLASMALHAAYNGVMILIIFLAL